MGKAGQEPPADNCGRVQLDLKYFDLLPGELGEAEVVLVKAKFQQAKLPPKSDNQAKVIVGMKNGDWSIKKESQVGKEPVVQTVDKAIAAVTRDVVKRAADK